MGQQHREKSTCRRAYAGAGTHPFSGLGTLNIYSPHEFQIRASDTEDNPLNMLSAVKDDAALVLGPKFKLKFDTTTADQLAENFAPLPAHKTGLPANPKGYKGSGKVDSVITYNIYQMSMQPIIDVWFSKMHQIINDNTMFQVVSDLYTGVLPVQDNKPVIDQDTYKKVLEKESKEATQGQIESLQITGIPKITVNLKLGEEAAEEADEKSDSELSLHHMHYSDDFWNGLTNNGQSITQLHTVKSGDTFSSVARKYRTPLREAILLNPTFDLSKLSDWKRGAKPGDGDRVGKR